MRKLIRKFAHWLIRLTNEKETAIQMVGQIFDDIKEASELADLSDRNLAELLLKRVWAEFPSFGQKAEITNSAIDRLHRANGGPIDPFYGLPEEDKRECDDAIRNEKAKRDKF